MPRLRSPLGRLCFPAFLVLDNAVSVFRVGTEARGLFGVIGLHVASGLFTEDIVKVLEGLFKHVVGDYS
jgi:hypothetical protein